MNSNDQDRAFLIEIRNEYVFTVKDQIITLKENNGKTSNSEFVNLVEFVLHSIKGESRACGFESFSQLIHETETKLLELKLLSSKDRLRLINEHLDIIYQNIEYIEAHIEDDDPIYRSQAKKQLVPPVSSGWGMFEDEQEESVVLVSDQSYPEIIDQPMVKVDLPKKYLICSIKNRKYGLPIENIVEIIPDQPLGKLPYPDDKIEGVISLKGTIFPIIVVRRDDKSKKQASRNSIIVCRTSAKAPLGIKVETVTNVISFTGKDILPIEDSNTLEDYYVTQLSNVNDEPIFFINVDRLIA